ncbi:hypothetical protein FNYG_08888 [Fusarium nygamai]|uniref:Uncharacterized protein n=1 Tax=Gibberella nygamai TaxID=42673 RepID=A0A2K0W693_GIBNY|nr:hypothetical protein FNYG_08888 [Fusarium nygamai]
MSSQQDPASSASGSHQPQRSILRNLPEEVQVLIVENISADEDASVETLGSLTQTCIDLYRIARRDFFHANNFKVFRKAVESADVSLMSRCEEYDAAPVHLTWCVEPSMKEYRPIDALLLNLDERLDNGRSEQFQDEIRGKVFESLKWLLERGADAEATWVSESLEDELPPGRENIGFGHMPTRLLKQLKVNIGKCGIDVYIDMIELLSSHGFPNPTRADALAGSIAMDSKPYHHSAMTWMTKPHYPFCDRTMRAKYFVCSPLDLPLRPYIPPRLLELMLKEYASRGIKLRDSYNRCPDGLEKTARGNLRNDCYWDHHGLVNCLVGDLHVALHSPSLTHWKESWHGEVADDFRQKVNIMVKYQMIDEEEEALMRSLLRALDSITAEITGAGGLRAEHFKTSWIKLCDAVRPFLSDEYDLFYDASVSRPPGPRRVHKFIIGDWWNPWEEYFVQSDAWKRLKLTKEALGDEEFSSRTQQCWESHYDFEREFLNGFFTYLDMPEWYEVDYEEWRQLFLKTFSLDRILSGDHFWIPKHLKTDLEKWCEANGGTSDDKSLGFKWWKQRIPTDK